MFTLDKYTEFMKQLLKFRKGFTLVELLIVVALLGALAIGLLASVDPFEQLKKGRDTSNRNTVAEFLNASVRYYSIKSTFPWSTSITAKALNTMGSDVTLLISAGELKKGFIELAGTGNAAKIYVTSATESVTVCYKPESKGFQLNANTIYASDGSTAASATCKGASGTADCFFCLQ